MDRPPRARRFTYGALDLDVGSATITCHYELDGRHFAEVATFGEEVDLGAPGVVELAGLYHLLAATSYYKLGAPPEVDLAGMAVGPEALALLAAALHDGLGEFAYRNGLDLDDVAVRGAGAAARGRAGAPERGPLVPFGGGIDSIVTVASLAEDADAALFVLGPTAEPYEAIERPARRTGLPVLRCRRTLDPGLRDARGFDGHVPVTAIVSTLALVAAVGTGREAVLMSNERSASSPNLVVRGRAINHQWSKSFDCEQLLRAAIAERVEGGPSYESVLRDRSELWVAAEFSRLDGYLDTFMSCNRAFRQDPATRATTWCGECDKCRFTDLVLAPFVPRARLEQVFGGHEPLADPAAVPDLEVLCGVVDNPKPFECVGDVEECATALVATAARADRADQAHLAALARRCTRARPLERLLAPDGPTNSRRLDAARDLV